MTLRPCLDCHALTGHGSRCRACDGQRQAAIERRRGTATQRGYDAVWARRSRELRRRQPWCTHCLATEDLSVHHVQKQRQGGGAADGNMVVLCRDCHAAAEREACGD